ncbi:hypothetical protein K5549_003724 [Capra hircus]|nr:hypothetical protein K5549_003724 [Capra hircus]
MSDRRESSGPLSSRTQQRALEDKEEQEREHRRRLWNLRFTTDDEDLPAPESTSMRLPASSVKLGLKVEEYLSAIQRSESVMYANPFHTEFPVAPVDVTSKRNLFEKELLGQSQEDPASSHKNQETQRELAAGSKPQWRKKPEAPLGAEKISVLEERAVSGKRAVPDKASDSEKRSVSEKATVFEKTPVPEMQPAPGRAVAPVWPQDWEHSASAECPSSPRRQRGTGPEKEPESSAGPLPQAGGLPPVTLQVSNPSTEAEAKSPSPTVALPTFSSSLQRSSPHTISFRMSPRRDSSEAALTRSTSMRLPASSVKLGLKVEEYLSAIQRSESIRYANPFHTEFPVAPVDVTSKRHLFEKEQVGQSQESPASSRKNQETQRELAAGSKPQWRKKPEAPLGAEVSGGPAVWAALPGERGPAGTHSSTAGLAGGPGGQGTCWLLEAVCCTEDTDPEASLDPETPSPSKCSMFQKISVLEERAVSGKRAVPDKASDSEKRSVSEKATVFEKTPVPEMQPAPGRAMAPVWPQDWEHSASAECASSPRRQQGTGPEKESESSAGPLPRAGGLPPVTLQVSSPSTEAEAKSPSLVGQSRGPSLQPQGEWLGPARRLQTAEPGVCRAEAWALQDSSMLSCVCLADSRARPCLLLSPQPSCSHSSGGGSYGLAV